MKKITILFAALLVFMLQFSVVNAAKTTTSSGNEKIDLRKDKYDNLSTKTYSCGSEFVTNIPEYVPKLVHIVYIGLQIVTPIVLIVVGMINLLKAVIASKEEDMKKAQMLFLKHLVLGALIFFAFVFVKLIVSVTADASDKSKIIDCTSCFVNGIKKCTLEK